jgi:hypothetical protein
MTSPEHRAMVDKLNKLLAMANDKCNYHESAVARRMAIEIVQRMGYEIVRKEDYNDEPEMTLWQVWKKHWHNFVLIGIFSAPFIAGIIGAIIR